MHTHAFSHKQRVFSASVWEFTLADPSRRTGYIVNPPIQFSREFSLVRACIITAHTYSTFRLPPWSCGLSARVKNREVLWWFFGGLLGHNHPSGSHRPFRCRYGIMRWRWPSAEAAQSRDSKERQKHHPWLEKQRGHKLNPWRYCSGCERMMTIHTVLVTQSMVVLPRALLDRELWMPSNTSGLFFSGPVRQPNIGMACLALHTYSPPSCFFLRLIFALFSKVI